MPQYALRFISGKYQGGEFPIRMDHEIVIGRSSELDMVLVEDMVSRKHAKIAAVNGQVIIQDLGSTNGTFVNGEKVKKVRLKEGDRILIGTSIIKMVTLDNSSEVSGISDADARRRLEVAGRRRQQSSGTGRPMSGDIEEIPLPDLLQLLATSRKSGVLSVRGPLGVGKIFLRKGQIYFSTIEKAVERVPRKALFRLLTWPTGAFELAPPDERPMEDELQEPTEALLMEAMRQLDEVRRIERELPGHGARLALGRPLGGPLRGLTPVELDILQLVHNEAALPAILDRSPLTDLETLSTLQTLIGKKFVVTG